MSEKTVIIAGGTRGIGFALAQKLAEQKAKIILLGKNPENGQNAVEILKSKGAMAEFYSLDLSELSQIEEVAGKIRDKVSQLDLLVQCADLLSFSKSKTTEGIPRAFALNLVGRYFMVNQLQDLLVTSSPSTILHIALAGMAKNLDISKIPPSGEMNAFSAHQLGQAANDTLGVLLHHRLKDKGVRVIVTNPGMVDTNIRRQGMPLLGGFMDLLMKPFMTSPEKYADVLMELLNSSIQGTLFNRKGNPLPIHPGIGSQEVIQTFEEKLQQFEVRV